MASLSNSSEEKDSFATSETSSSYLSPSGIEQHSHSTSALHDFHIQFHHGPDIELCPGTILNRIVVRDDGRAEGKNDAEADSGDALLL